MAERTWTELGQILKQRRERLRMTQQEVADAGGLSLAIVQMLESGRKDSYRGTTLSAIAEALRWEPDAVDLLLNGTPADDLPTVDHPEDADPMEKGMAQLLEEFKRGNARLEARIEQLERAVREQGSAPHGQ